MSLGVYDSGCIDHHTKAQAQAKSCQQTYILCSSRFRNGSSVLGSWSNGVAWLMKGPRVLGLLLKRSTMLHFAN